VGSLLIGVVGPDGDVRYLGGPMPVTQEFVDTAREGRTPEARFRFAEPCQQGACANWSGRCGVVADVLAVVPDGTELSSDLPACGIRGTCVWFRQRGRDACAVCPAVAHTRIEVTTTSDGPVPRVEAGGAVEAPVTV
jgi:hypothetical protein